jgi:hypothetical protein
MKKLTRTTLGALLLAGSSTAVLAAGTSWSNPDTAAPPAAARPGATQNQPATSTGGARTQTASTGTQSSSPQQPSRQHENQSPYRAASVDPVGDRMTEALNLLGSDGYTSIETLTPQGQQFLATAKMNGRDVSVLVDPQTHQVTNRG